MSIPGTADAADTQRAVNIEQTPPGLPAEQFEQDVVGEPGGHDVDFSPRRVQPLGDLLLWFSKWAVVSMGCPLTTGGAGLSSRGSAVGCRDPTAARGWGQRSGIPGTVYSI
jgi:hypothetical protein